MKLQAVSVAGTGFCRDYALYARKSLCGQWKPVKSVASETDGRRP